MEQVQLQEDPKVAVKAEILGLLKSVDRKGIDELIAWLEKSSFFKDPASTKYHENIEGGLAHHSLNVYRCLKAAWDGTKPLPGQTNEVLQKLTHETVIIVSLLHDLCKVGCYTLTDKWRKDKQDKWEKYQGYDYNDVFPFGHGEKSVVIALQFIKLSREEMLAIRWHMGWSEEHTDRLTFGKAIEVCPLISLLHSADMTAGLFFERVYKD